MWVLDNEKYSAGKTRCSTDGSDRSSSHKRSSHKRSASLAYPNENLVELCSQVLQCFDICDWTAGRHLACKNMH